MTQHPKGSQPRMKRIKKVEFYQEVLGRLTGEVGTILRLIDEYNKTVENKIGFWACIRMIMPVIETVAYAAGEKRPQDFLLNQLDVRVPYVTWDLFRHSLMHGDFLRCAEYQSKQVRWGVMIGGQGHNVASGHICIDLTTLYEKLADFLRDEIKKNDQTIIEVEESLVYSSNSYPQIIAEFSKL